MRRLLLPIALFACAGKAPEENPGPDAPVDEVPLGPKVSGKVMDYFGAVALDGSTVATDGIDPPKAATSEADGSYALDDFPVGSKVFFSVSRPDYRPTRNVATSVVDADVEQDIYVMSVADVTRQYTTLGLTPTAGRAVFAVELQRNNGTPLVGVPLEDFLLVDALDQPVPGIRTVFFGALDVDPDLLESTAVDGRARLAILDVPPGAYSLQVTILDGEGNPRTLSTSLAALADGATLGVLGGIGGAGGGGGNPDPSFAADVYPRLQRAALGGLGCANCHTAGGVGAVLVLDAPAADVLASLMPPAPGGRIDSLAPVESMLLTKPLYELEPPQDHPNATFLDTNDPDYRLILRWISNGLKP
jgi:hypothetical protein